MIELNKVYNEDFMEGVKLIPDCSIDLIVTDPPYKMNHSTGGCTNIGFKDKWQGNIKAGNTVMDFNTDIRFSKWLPEIYRILKPNAHTYIFTNDKNMLELLTETTKAGFRLSNILVWYKNNCTPNRYYMKNGEFILFLYKDKAKPINDMSSKTIIDIKNINGKDKLHPTEKPIDLLKIYINNSSSEGDIILDPFMGSGSTAVACIETKRNYIGFEIDKKYIEAYENRIKNII